MDMKLKILVLIVSEKVPPLMLQVVLLQAHQVLQLTTVEAGPLELFEMSICSMRKQEIILAGIPVLSSHFIESEPNLWTLVSLDCDARRKQAEIDAKVLTVL